jgi:glycosyltransferase involved in cell wall biosynthesis
MGALRILLLAPGANPESLATALVAYAHSEALARLNSVTLVTGPLHEEEIKRAGAPFRGLEIVASPWLDRLYLWALRRIFKFNYGSHALTAFGYPFNLAFEWKAWRTLKKRILAGEFDVVMRVAPVVSVLPSVFGFLLRKGPIPFVVGPINGGLPWPKGFSQAERQREWITGLRNYYRYLPFAKSTYRDATAIIAGSSNTCREFSQYRDKVFFVPENGLSRSLLTVVDRPSRPDDKLELIYIGRLVPYKGCDMAIRAVAPILLRDAARFTVVGDGPDRQALGELARSLGVEDRVSFLGWLSHADTMERLRSADVLVFPSVREFGGGVVFEALAVGAIPVVADFGGPGDIVHADVGFKVALTTEEDVVRQIQRVLQTLSDDRELLERLRRQGMAFARERLSWDGKAAVVTEILRWATGQAPKPHLPAPSSLQPETSTQSARA